MPAGHYDRSGIPRRGRPGYILKRAIEGDHDRDWMIDAACARADLPPDQLRAFAEIFFPSKGPERSHASRRKYEQQAAAAKAICHTCPVKQRCDYHADVLHEENGIWGGITEEERAQRKHAS